MDETSGTFVKDPTLVYISVEFPCILRGGGSWKIYREPSSRQKWCGGGTNPCDVGLDLSGSWQQGHSATYNAPSRI